MYIHISTSASYCTTALLKLAEEVSEARKQFMQRAKTKPEPVQSSSETHTLNGNLNSFRHGINHIHDHIQVERGKGDADSVLDASVQIAINVSLSRQDKEWWSWH